MRLTGQAREAHDRTVPRRILLPLVLAASGCVAHVSGNLQIDGAPFVVAQCASGQRFGFAGVELTDRIGRRVRLDITGGEELHWYRTPPRRGEAVTSVSEPGQENWDVVGACGPMDAEDGGGKGMLRRLEGEALLSCESTTHRISGKVQFDNCY